MDEMLQLYQDATGVEYDGNIYNVLGLMPGDGNESDVDYDVSSDTSDDEDGDLSVVELDLELDQQKMKKYGAKSPTMLG